ncbi:MAG: MG2 domain-containing protein, partial [Bacteroidota bacterium]|nr:MG2 domain-containing protein [Bacteroidota bacterium]
MNFINLTNMRRFSLFLMAMAIFLFSCSEKDIVKFEKESIPDEVNLQGNLHFRFNKDLVSDTALNLIDTTKYVVFDPPIQGRFKWIEKKELLFMPIQQLKPSTNYIGKIKSSVTKNKKAIKLSSDNKYSFHTPYIEFLSFTGYWAERETENKNPVIHFDLVFNYLVDPQQAKQFVAIWVDDIKSNFRFKNNGNAKVLTAVIDDFTFANKDFQAKIQVNQGIKAVNGNVPINTQVEKETSLLSPYKVMVYDIQAVHNGNEGRLTVSTSQEIDESAVKKHLNISPSIKYKLEMLPQGFVIVSENFNLKSKYKIVIADGLPGKIGGKLKYEFVKDISFGKLKPSIKFTNTDRVYLSGKGNKNIEINIINVDEISVEIYKLYENNILQALSGLRHYWDYHSDEYRYGYNFYNVSRLSDQVWETKIETSTLPRQGNKHIFHLDFKDKFSKFPGIYFIKVYSDKNYWLKDQQLISISDIGLMAKKGRNFITVFANSIKTADALANVELKFIGSNNQLSGTATTDNKGVASFKISELPADGFDVKLITASLGDDYNYLPFKQTSVNSSRFDVGGKYSNPSGYDSYIYGDRDIYRPGETINLACIIRNDNWQLPGEMPIKVKFIAPNGKEVRTFRKTLSGQGDFDVSFALPASAMTGSYSAQVYTSNDVFLASKNISIEEFMPDRIKVDLKTNLDSMMLNDVYEADVVATNFFGPPAANRNYEASFTLQKRNFGAKTKESYNFYIEGISNYFDETLREGTTDPEGKASESFTIDRNFTDMGQLKGDLYFTVFDETGRPVHSHKSVSVFTQDVFYGIGYGSYYIKTGNSMSIPLVACNTKGKPLQNHDAEVTLIKHEYKSVLSRSGSYFRYQSEKEEKIIEKKIISLYDESVSFSFSPQTSGKYEIRINKPGVNNYVSRNFWSYGWGSTSYSSFKVDTEGNIDVEFDKDNYKVGETATVLLKAPFAGKILICIEGHDVIDHFYIETDKRAASFELPITAAFVPNVYISATLIKAHDVSDFPLLVAHGFHPMMVEDNDNKMNIEIVAKEKSRSKTKQTIKIKSDPNSQLSIAAVDEGILQITGFQTPNPYDFFYQKKALEVKSYDLYPLLFPEVKTNQSSTGGDGMDLGKRINPMTSKRVKLVSMWSGIIETDNNGNASFDIDIPQFSGSLRIMAVSYRDKKFGSTSSNMTVADPLVISAALPRFLSPADTIEVPVTISNTTDDVARCKTEINTKGPLDIVGDDDISVEIPANSEMEVVYRVSVQQAIGQSNITILVDAFGEEFSYETDIPVRPAAPLQKRSGSGIVKAGGAENFNMANEFIPASASNKLLVSKSPLIEFADDLDYLIRYPYGCVEQTVSSVFPQLYFGDIVKDIYGYDADMEKPAINIREAINKLMLMQLYNGGLTYWPGHGHESWWGSVYACHFLLEAKKAGYQIDPSFLDNLYGFLLQSLKDKKTEMYYYNGNSKREIVPKQIPYSLYVLAMAGKPQYATMNYYKARPNLLSLDSRYLLAASYALSGDMDKYREILPAEFSGEESNSAFGGSFYSYIRDEAISLNALLEAEPDNPQIAYMAKHLTEMLKTRRHLNTQERAFTFTALGKIAAKSTKSDIKAEIFLDRKSIANFDNVTLNLHGAKLEGNKIEIKAKGNGHLYYFWESEGISADGSYKTEDSFLKVRKYLYDRNGNYIRDLSFEQNDLIVVKITLQATQNTYVENVAITDMLPAGFEIENTRLSDIPDLHWIKDNYNYDYRDIRDDRISLFVSASSTVRSYYYFVRAVSPGVFQMGPVGADAMYNGEYH